MKYQLIVIGSGPGGYVAAIRAAQLGLKTAVVERAELGGICLNWGCIPTKTLLKSAQVMEYAKKSSDFGVNISGEITPDIEKIVARSREVASNMSKGIQFLFKKNNIDLLQGFGKLVGEGKVEVEKADGEKEIFEADHIILATGARSKQLPNLPQDGTKIIGYRKALVPDRIPKSMIVAGSGAIGSEFAYFYSTLGTKVTLVEFLPNIVPNEDEEVSKQLARSFKKTGIDVMTDSAVESVDTSGELCLATIKTPRGEKIIEAEIVLSAVGITPNIEDIGLEKLGIIVEKGKVKVDEYYRTNVKGIYAIGDIVAGQALAHAASAEAICCVEKIAGHHSQTVDYSNIPGCTYTNPEISSTGMTEKAAKDAGYEIKVGKFPFMALGKANAAGSRDGFIKLIFDAKTDKILGAHFIGMNVTEMIAEIVAARKMNATGIDLIKSVHPHPTMSEAIMEAAAVAYGEAVHL